MARLRLLLVVALLGGCATTDRDSYMPSEAQETWRNPHRLVCPTGSVPVCDSSGSYLRKNYTNCRCMRR